MQKIEVTIEATINDDGRLVLGSSTVIGDLDLTGLPVRTLPTCLTIRGSLHLQDTEISHLPADLHVMQNLDLSGTEVSIIYDGLIVGKDLKLGERYIYLPKGTQVHGDLYLPRSLAEHLTEGITVGGKVHPI